VRSEDRDRERGSAVVEFALVLPFLFLALLAVLRVGLVARDALLVREAARAAAREAAVTEETERIDAAVIAAVAGLDAARLEVLVTRAGVRGDPVTAVVRYEHEIGGGGWNLLPDAVLLEAKAVMRQEFG
jgi:Flp pilus assembly protein TadG